MKIAVISCTKLKKSFPCVAASMYMVSPLFRKARKYVSSRYLYWYILSAEYGLLRVSDHIHPYDKTLSKMPAADKKEWARMVANDLITIRPTEVHFFAGKDYRKYVIPLLEAEGIKCVVPLEGLGIGQQLSWYKKQEEAE